MSTTSTDRQSEELSVTEMADKLGLHASTIRAWIHQNRLPAQKHGRGWVLREADVLKLLEDHPSLGKAHRLPEGHPRRPRTRPSSTLPRRPRSIQRAADLVYDLVAQAERDRILTRVETAILSASDPEDLIRELHALIERERSPR